MSRLVAFMARWRLTWVLWLSLGTPIVTLSALLDFIRAVARAVRVEWYEQGPVFSEWFASFGESARLAQPR